MRKLYPFFLAIAVTFLQPVSGQQLLVQDFNFSGSLAPSNGWMVHSGTTNPISTTTGLTYANYAGSGIGNAALVAGVAGQDVNVTFPSQNTNGQNVYYAFLVNVNDGGGDKSGDYFFHTGSPGGTSWTNFSGRVFVRVVGGSVNFGISNTATTTTINTVSWGVTGFTKNTPYLLVLKYTINTGGSDAHSLWVLPSGVPASEAVAGTPEATNTTSNGTDAVNAVGLRQGSTSQPQTVVDGIRVGNTWADAVQSSGPAPTLSPSPSTLSGFAYTTGSGPSTSQSFALTGSNLSPATGDVTVTGSANYEVSPNNSTWSGSFTLPYTGGALASATVYVRLKAGLPAGSYNESISLTGGGATSSVSVSGSVSGGSPTVSATPASLTGFSTSQGTASPTKTFSASGSNLTGNITVTAPADYEVSLSAGSGFASSITLIQSSGSVAATTVYVRIKSTAAAGSPSGNVSVAAAGASTQNVAVSGTVSASSVLPFTANNLVVYRVGDGSGTLTSAAAPVFIDEYTTTTGMLVQSVPLPTSGSGTNRALTAAGSATTEGFITRSIDKDYLLVSGYDAPVSTAAVNGTSSATTNRVIGRIASSASIETNTALSDLGTGGVIRGVASTNGTDLWVTGSVNGVRYTTAGATTSTQLSTTTTNLRAVGIFGNQLYVSTASGSIRLATVGAGLPTTSGQTITNLPGFPTATGSPYAFFFADLDASVTGVDVVYVADENIGIQKYSLASGSWVANGSVSVTGNNLRGLTGFVSGSSVTLYGTTPGALYALTDATGYNATLTATPSLLASAAANTAFRGIAFTPGNITAPVRFSSIAAAQKGNGIQVEWTNGAESGLLSYRVERSADGRNFAAIGNPVTPANAGSGAYRFVDGSPLKGDNFYRVRATETDGRTTHSSIVRVSGAGGRPELWLLPNPVQSDLTLQFANLPAGSYRLQISNAQGQEIKTFRLAREAGSFTTSMAVSDLPQGVYFIRLSGPATFTKQFLKN